MDFAYPNFDRLYRSVRSAAPRAVAVAAAEDADVLRALARVAAEGLARGILVGDEARIRAAAAEGGVTLGDCRIVQADSDDEAAARAVALVREGAADLLMKGRVETAPLMKQVLDPERGLRDGRALTHIGLTEVPTYPRFLFLTDGGINIVQDLATKRDIIANAVDFCRRLGIASPNVALLALVERVNPKLPETELAAELAAEAARGAFPGCTVEGPVALDVALSAKAAKKKGIESRIAGVTDVFVGANITATNHVVKALLALGHARVGGVVVGARVPIVLLSRSDASQTKVDSIVTALAWALGDRS